jgi:hypothetical protein
LIYLKVRFLDVFILFAVFVIVWIQRFIFFVLQFCELLGLVDCIMAVLNMFP